MLISPNPASKLYLGNIGQRLGVFIFHLVSNLTANIKCKAFQYWAIFGVNISEYLWYLCVIFQEIVLYLCFPVFRECDLFFCGIFLILMAISIISLPAMSKHILFLTLPAFLPSFSRLFYSKIASRWSTISASGPFSAFSRRLHHCPR
jgi:hypothetical protein